MYTLQSITQAKKKSGGSPRGGGGSAGIGRDFLPLFPRMKAETINCADFTRRRGSAPYEYIVGLRTRDDLFLRGPIYTTSNHPKTMYCGGPVIRRPNVVTSGAESPRSHTRLIAELHLYKAHRLSASTIQPCSALGTLLRASF